MSQIKYCQLSQQFGRLDTVPKCVRQTDKQADRQTDRQTDGMYFALRVRFKKEKKTKIKTANTIWAAAFLLILFQNYDPIILTSAGGHVLEDMSVC